MSAKSTKSVASKSTKSAKSKAEKVTPKSKATTAKKVERAAKVAPKAEAKPQASTTNPYRVGGGYWASVEALRTLGVGKMHAFDKIIPAVVRAMGAEAFKAFKAKDARNENGKDVNGRILQNVQVCSRQDEQYGGKLRAIGFEVRWDGREKKAGLFKIK